MSTDLEKYIIDELQGGFTRSGLSTNEWSVEIIKQSFEISETGYTKIGDPIPKTPQIKVSPINCLDQEVIAKLTVDTKEKETTTWSINSEVAVTQELELTAKGDILVAEAEGKGKIGVTFKVGGGISGTSEREVDIIYEQPVPVKAKHRTIMELGIFKTPVEGFVKGVRLVRVKYQYDLDVPFQFFDETHSGTALVKVPFQVDFKSEIISYVPKLRDQEVDCDTAFSALTPGQQGYNPLNHPIFGERPSGTAVALASTISEPIPGTSISSRTDRILMVAARSDSPAEMAETLGWTEADLPVAERIFTMVDNRFSGMSAELLERGIIDLDILERTPTSALLAAAS